MLRIPVFLLLFSLGLLGQMIPAVAGEAPPLDALIARIATALGGVKGGQVALDAAPAIDLLFRRTLKESHSSAEIVADHRYVAVGKHERLDIRMVSGEGKDSAVAVADSAWLAVDGLVHPVEVDAARAQLSEFDPRRFWSVPFALAADGRQIMGASSLTLEGTLSGEGADRYLLVGRDADGKEIARLEVDTKTYRPTMVQFESSSGRVEYRYSDYHELAPGLIVPLRREFLRNGTRISQTSIVRAALTVPVDRSELFDPARADLPPLGVPKGT